MRKEISYISTTLRSVLNGEPWYGRSVMSLLRDVDPADVFRKPNEDSHSMIELLYHMNTWAEFTLHRLQKTKEDAAVFDELDWRIIDPDIHSWEKGLEEFQSIHENLLTELETVEDEFLSEIVDYRKYNFRFLLHGIIQHDIYHIGQIAYLEKMFG